MSTEPEPFGVTVRRAGDGWHVYLPHQCDTWSIAGELEYRESVPHVEAVAALEHLITESLDALAALRAEEEFGS